MEELQQISELQATAEKVWLFISACVIVVLGIAAISVLIWWVVENIKDLRKENNNQINFDKKTLEHQRDINAAAADVGWNNYFDLKEKHDRTIEKYEYQIESMCEWDLKRIRYIEALKKQLQENNIVPIETDKENVA